MLVYEVGDTTGPPSPQAYFNVEGTVTERDLERLTRNSGHDSIKTVATKLGANLGGDEILGPAGVFGDRLDVQVHYQQRRGRS